MRTLGTIPELRPVLDRERTAGRTVGLVPTMGYLHDGHLSLMRQARAEIDVVVASIFVNPLQFGVDVLFVPGTREMYPAPVLTTVSVAQVADPLEGAARPHHFAGVATVVAKLFAIVGPCRAYFGEKDFQQLAVVRRMAGDLSFPVDVVGCPTVRELDGLALSSRNSYLTAEEREAAPVVYRALRAGVASILAGERDPAAVRSLLAGIIEAEPLAQLDYAEVVDADSFRTPVPLAGNLRLLAAVRFGRARLIDNVGVTVPAPTQGG